MPLLPNVKAMLEQAAAANVPALHTLAPRAARAAYARLRETSGEPEPVAKVDDRLAPGPGGEIPVRVYTPNGSAPFPVLVYFHGGGWVIGSIETHDPICRTLANAARCIVVSVEYRRAPEHTYPAAADDAYAATAWAFEQATTFDGDPARIAVGGDSAGGNLAAVVTQMVRDRGAPSPIFQLLVYPVMDYDFSTSSYRDNADGYFLTQATMRWFWKLYLANEADGTHPYASPLRAPDVSGLPPGLVITAEDDPLRDEGEAYAARLRDAGVSMATSRYDGMVHGFFHMTRLLPQAKRGIDEAAAALRAALAP